MSAPGRASRAEAAMGLCRDAFASAVARPQEAGLALIAVGGFGRGELAPYSDLDVILVHAADRDVSAVAEELWYPMWDSGVDLDHSVRSLAELEDAAGADVRVALGMLDARHLAGDDNLTLQLRTRMLADWRRHARRRLPHLRELTFERHQRAGELAHLSVPDLKDAEGGLRDAGVLKALMATWLVDVPHADLERCRLALLDVRDALHRQAGRRVDRILPEAWSGLAEILDYPDALAAQRRIRELGRRMTHLSRLAWRRVDSVLARPRVTAARRPELISIDGGVAVVGGEIGLSGWARPANDPLLLIRAAALAAEQNLVLSPVTAARLVRECPPLPQPWPREGRSLFVRLLAAGPGLLPVWETLEEVGAIERILPEWERIRLLPHASAIHRFTVDRHSIETCLEASRLIRRVGRPDVLLVAALLHDIGKGGTESHSVVGEPLARTIAARMGFVPEKVDQVARLVRWHLLLSTLATTRDPDDMATVSAVAEKLETPEDLELLAVLTEADARAASPAAWSTWRAGLVARLVANVSAELQGHAWELQTPQVAVPQPGGDGVAIAVLPASSGAQVLVAAPDRVGLLADVAGALLLSKHSVREARVWHQGGLGCSLWEVSDADPQVSLMRQRFAAIAGGQLTVSNRIPAPRPGQLAAEVRLVPGAGSGSSVFEVKAQDRLGVVYLVCQAMADLGFSITSAHVDTVGPQAVDVFYVTAGHGGVLSEEQSAAAIGAITLALNAPGEV